MKEFVFIFLLLITLQKSLAINDTHICDCDTVTNSTSYPWIVFLNQVSSKDDTLQRTSIGILISHWFVLTSKHWISDDMSIIAVIELDGHWLGKRSSHNIDEIHQHPKQDFAVLKLKNPVNQEVKLACLNWHFAKTESDTVSNVLLRKFQSNDPNKIHSDKATILSKRFCDLQVSPETYFEPGYRSENVNRGPIKYSGPIDKIEKLIDLDVFCAVMDRSDEKSKFLDELSFSRLSMTIDQILFSATCNYANE